MPVYIWKDKKTGYRTEIYRSSFSEYNDPPKEEELPEEEQGKEREWEKAPPTGVRLTNPNKGNWIILIAGGLLSAIKYFKGMW